MSSSHADPLGRLEMIAAAILLVGGALGLAGIWLGEDPNPQGIAWMLAGSGALLFLLGGALLCVIGVASLGRRSLRATGVLPAPPSSPVPTPGWPHWRFAKDDAWHEVWADVHGAPPRILYDGHWVDATRAGRALTFTLDGLPAVIEERVDVAAVPLDLAGNIGVALISGGTTMTSRPTTRHELRIDGEVVPRRGVATSPGSGDADTPSTSGRQVLDPAACPTTWRVVGSVWQGAPVGSAARLRRVDDRLLVGVGEHPLALPARRGLLAAKIQEGVLCLVDGAGAMQVALQPLDGGNVAAAVRELGLPSAE